ncbi:SixA phosphatase family protein [Flavobacterium difficile]|uniref:Histidine phosphatase family protein n=1 Tax=Flavobacterium difficile TaxID=2709659 RepID=A0ABX0I2E4_9FLAO|nr:phosphoglycerate mutase family protein [Flavobacterium difficile]NHM01338.1 histidine phosphatase family protein [Flavobacterium difficile]
MMKYIFKTLLIFFSFVGIGFSQSTPVDETTITKIILVRHAEKADDGTKNPPLSEIGILRAEKLNTLLADIKIDSLYATPYKRTEQTLEIVSKKRNLKISNYNPSDKLFSENLLKNKGKTMLVAGHSNTIPALVNTLIKSNKFEQLAETEFGKIWILTFKNNEFIDCSLITY